LLFVLKAEKRTQPFVDVEMPAPLEKGKSMNTITISTGQISRLSQPYLDITVKSGQGLGKLLAPTWDMVMGIKKATLSEEAYTGLYLELLRSRYRSNKNGFLQLLEPEGGELVLACFCRPHTFCHRYIAVDVLQKIGQAHGINVEYAGERTAK
jgi:hypothetical protein